MTANDYISVSFITRVKVFCLPSYLKMWFEVKTLRQTLKPLLVLSSVAGVGCFKKPSVGTKLYLFILIVLNISFNIYSFFQISRYREIVYTFEGQILNIFITVGCISMIIATNFRETMTLETIDRFDISLGIPVPRRKLLLWVVLIIHRLEMFLFILFGLLEVLINDRPNYLHYIFSSIQQIQFDIARSPIYWMSAEFCTRFKILKKHFLLSFKAVTKFETKEGIVSFIQTQKFIKSIRKVSKLHNTLCDELDLINDSFGMIMFFDVLISMAYMVQLFTKITELAYLGKVSEEMWFLAVWFVEYSVSK